MVDGQSTQARPGRIAVVGRVAAAELRRMRRDRSLHGLGGACALLLVLAAALGWMSREAQKQERERLDEIARGYWEAQPDRHPHRVAHYGQLVFRPLDRLAIFDPGVDAYAGSTLFLEAHEQRRPMLSEAAQRSGLVGFGALSPAVVLTMLLPLLLIALGFRTIAGERERGMWELLLAQGLSPRLLAIGKALAVAAAAGLASLPAVGVLAALAASGASLGRAAALILTYGVYLLVLAAGVVLVSYAARSARGALLMLVALYAVGWIGLPRVASSVAERIHPAPSDAEFELRLTEDLREIADSHNPDDPFFQKLEERYLEEHGVNRREDLPINFGGVVMREAEALTTEVFRAHYDALYERWRGQDDRALALAGLAPAMSLRALSSALAGTDATHVADFQRQAEKYRFELIQWLNELHTHEIEWEDDRAQRVSKEHWQSRPPFEYEPPSVRDAAANAGLAGAGLLAWLVLVGGLLIALPNRLEVRR